MFFAPPPGSSKSKKGKKGKNKHKAKEGPPSPLAEDRIAFCDFQFVRKGLGATDLMYLLGKTVPTRYRLK